MTAALEGLRVVDLSRGPAGGIATMILADFGAEVIAIDPPFDDPLGQVPAARMWRRGKSQLRLDLNDDDDLARLHSLLAAADILICSWKPETLKRRELDYASVSERHPHLIYGHVSGFGSHGPRANVPGYEGIVAATSGRMSMYQGIVDRDGPVYSALQVATHVCAQSLVAGTLAALHARADTGAGRLVETSLLQGLMPYEQNTLLGRQFPQHVKGVPMVSTPEPPMPSLFYHPAQAGDGRWIQFGNLLPHLFDNFLMVTELIDVVADPDWDAEQMRLPKDKTEAFRDRMFKRIQERTAAEWIAAFTENGSVASAPYQTTQEAMHDPDVVANGHVIERDGALELGPVARLSETPAQPGQGGGDIDQQISAWSDSPRPAPSADATRDLPLSGVRVLEMSTIIAGPLAASFLADMGADVIKVEQVKGDPYRGMAQGMGYSRVNAGKRSISINLKSPDGQKIVHALIAEADIIIHNYRPGVPERLGIDYKTVSNLNPGVIYIQSNGYGPDGPSALRPSTHPVPGAAMGGATFQMGERLPKELLDTEQLRIWAPRLMRANDLNPDPNTSVVICSAAMLGLNARRNTGKGQRILVDMFGANTYANHDDFVSYPGKAPRAVADELGYGLAPTYRLYRCADNTWVFLAIPQEKEQTRFQQIIEAEGLSAPDFSTGDDAVTASLEALFLTRPAMDWETLLAGQGIGCVRADGIDQPEFLMKDEQSRQLGLIQSAVHPVWGEYIRHGSNIHFDGAAPAVKPPPYSGQHGADLLATMGYSETEINSLFEQGVVWRPAD